MATPPITPSLYSDLDKRLPIVMLPVRVETRYFGTGTNLELRVRIFPSNAHVTTDRPSPDPVERDETVAYWTTRKAQGDDAPATAATFGRLTDLFGPARAQWLRRIFTPTANPDGSLQFPDVPLSPASSDGTFLASQATALPTRFIVSGFAGPTRVFIAAGTNIPASVAAGPHGDPAAIAWQTDFAAAEAIGLGVRIRLTPTTAGGITRLYVYGVRESADASTASSALQDLLERHIRSDGAALLQAGTPTNNTAGSSTAPLPLAPEVTPGPLSDGFRVSTSLGLDPSVFAAIGGSIVQSDSHAVAMHLALWPATVEYFLRQAMSPLVADLWVTRARSSFVSYVRPSGPFPTLLLGSQPYGILPVTASASRLNAVGNPDPFLQFLLKLAADWRKAAVNAPHLGASADAGADLIAVLSQSPVSRRWRGRTVESQLIAGRNFTGAKIAAYDAAVSNARTRKVQQELTPLAIAANPFAIDFIFNHTGFDIRAPLVAPDDANRQSPLAANYITALNTAKLDDIKSETIAGATPRTLLYLFLRHSTLLLLESGAAALLDKPAPTPAVFVESAADTVWARLKTPLAALGNQSLADSFHNQLPNNILALSNLNLHRQALNTLAALSVGELERLAAGAIDAASHRLDAWITAQATEILHSMRGNAPTGAHLGAYAWVDGPAFPQTPAVDGAPPVADPDSQGYLHAPRLEHARTAAILRAAYLDRASTGAQAQFAIDLSSDRVRLAKQLAHAVEAGSNLSELLSSRIERLMADLGLGPQLPALRAQFPLDAGDGRQRIDGVALAQAWLAAPPAANLLPVYNVLLSTIDAVGDLLLSEAIHQQSSGSPGRARTALSALETGATLPRDFDIVRTAPDSVTTTWRLILPVAETALPSWISGLIGDPAALSATITTVGSAPTTATLASLAIGAAQLLDFVPDSPDAPGLAQKFSEAAGGGDVAYSPELEIALTIAYAISLLMRNARTLSPADLGDIARTPLGEFGAAAKRRQWLHDVGRIRQPIQALSILDAALAARGGTLPLQFGAAGPNLSLVTLGDWPDANATGMLLDGWNETTPGVQAATGIALHYNAPRSRPPQAILLMVPPDANTGWNVFTVESILAEAADLARMRLVRPSDVHGSFLPALYFADNLKADTVATNFLQTAFVTEVKA